MCSLLIPWINVSSISIDTVTINQSTCWDIVVNIEFLTTTVCPVDILTIEIRVWVLSYLCIERCWEIPVLVWNISRDRACELRISREEATVIWSIKLTITIHITDDRLSFKPTVCSIVIVRRLYLLTRGEALLLCNLIIRNSHHLVWYYTILSIAPDKVHTTTDKERVRHTISQFVALAVNLKNLILVMCDVCSNRYIPVLIFNNHTSKRSLNTCIAYRTYICPELYVFTFRIKTSLKREWNLKQKIIWLLGIEINSTRETALQYSEVNTDVELLWLLPLQSLVNDRGTIAIKVLTSKCIDWCSLWNCLGSIPINTVTVTCHTISQT